MSRTYLTHLSAAIREGVDSRAAEPLVGESAFAGPIQRQGLEQVRDVRVIAEPAEAPRR